MKKLENLKRILKIMFKSDFFIWIVASIILTYLVELISISFSGTLYVGQGSILNCFIYNLLFILATTCIIFLFKRRVFLFTLISIIWLALSLGNMMLLSFRGSPLTASDVQMIKMGATLMEQYFTKVQLFMLLALVVVIIATLIFLFIKIPKKEKVNYLIVVPSIIIFAFFFNTYSNKMLSSGVVSTNFWDINTAYKTYGFPYSFSNTVFNYGIDKPENYSKYSIDEIVNEINGESIAKLDSESVSVFLTNEDENTEPNVIIVQLESFFDPTLINDLTFSEDPIPNFRKLSEQYSSGYVRVPTIGGGTSNTEFEVLTGLSTKFFGPGQFPYNSILQSSPSESIAYYLKDQGYATTAIHNHYGTFYGRNIAYSNLGFDRFLSRETMNIWEYTPLTYAKDTVFTRDIPEVLASTSERDFIYAVSMQGHGSYPDYKILDEVNIDVSGDNLSQEDIYRWQYYLQQINEMDQMILDLINKVNESGEPTVIAFFGDHLPSLNINNERLSTGTIYDTPLLIWNNLGLDKEDLSLTSYQLSSYILDKLNIDGGIISSLHKNNSEKDNYLDQLHAIEYDILYGKKYSYNEENPYSKTDLIFGLKNPIINQIEYENDLIILKGGNFTEASKVFVNGKEVSTLFYGDTLLAIPIDSLKSGDTYTIRQIANDGTALNESDEYIY